MSDNMSQLIIIGKTSAFVGSLSWENNEFFTDVKFFALKCSRLSTVLLLQRPVRIFALVHYSCLDGAFRGKIFLPKVLFQVGILTGENSDFWAEFEKIDIGLIVTSTIELHVKSSYRKKKKQ